MTKKVKLVYGVGINDTDYQVKVWGYSNGKRKLLWICPYYSKWKSMLERCYSKRFQEKNPTYKGCIVCNEWLLFSNFRKWMIQQEWEGRQLDKDFLIENNKVYSHSTCVLVPQKVNKFITTSGKTRGEYPLGVHLRKDTKKNPFQSICGDGSTKVHLGYYLTPEQAHQAWLVKKLEICEEYLVEFKDESLIVQGLIRIKQKIEYHINANTELTSF